MNKKRILFVIGDIGGGHRSTSSAIATALHDAYPGKFETEIVDIFTESESFWDWALKESYSLSSNKLIWMYAISYWSSDFPKLMRFLTEFTSSKIVDRMKKYLKREKPDIIISVHPFTTNPIINARNSAGLDIPVVTVVSDPYTGHSSWLCDDRSDIFVFFSELAKIRAEMNGIASKKAFVTQIPVKPIFNNPLPEDKKKEWINKIKIDPNKLTILMAGGGEGLRGSIPIINKLNKFQVKPNILVVCGRNKDMYRDMKIISAEHSNVKPFGFIDFMYELMNLSDIIVLKAGTATIAEALLLEKVIIINSYVWGQERGNVRFCENNKVGFYIKSPTKVAEKIVELNNHPEEILKLKENIRKLNLYNGSEEIARKINSFFNSK